MKIFPEGECGEDEDYNEYSRALWERCKASNPDFDFSWLESIPMFSVRCRVFSVIVESERNGEDWRKVNIWDYKRIRGFGPGCTRILLAAGWDGPGYRAPKPKVILTARQRFVRDTGKRIDLLKRIISGYEKAIEARSIELRNLVEQLHAVSSKGES